MKNQLLTFIFFLFILKMNAQTIAVAQKMNVLYAGIENPVTIVVGKIPEAEMEVKISEGTITKKSSTSYAVLVNKVGNVVITVFYQGREYQKHIFRVKRIPNPIAFFQIKKGDRELRGSFKLVNQMSLEFEQFDYDVQCSIVSFQFTMTSPQKDPVYCKNIGAFFNMNVNEAIQKSKPNDVLYFDDVKVRCPGDLAERELNSLVFTVRDSVHVSK